MKIPTERAQQNLELLKAYKQEHDPRSAARLKQQISQLNQGLVRKESRKWLEQCAEPLEDLMQEAQIGLLKAIEKFDCSKGASFSSFAVPYISGAIQHYLRDRGWGTMRPPRRVIEDYAMVVRSHKELLKAGRTESLDQTAIGLGFNEEKWRQMKDMRSRKPLISLDERTDDGSPRLEIVDELDLQEGIEQEDIAAWLFTELSQMPDLQRQAISEFVFGNEKHRAIAKRHGCSPTMVEILIDRGLQKLRNGHVSG